MNATLLRISTMLLCTLIIVACSNLELPPYDELLNEQPSDNEDVISAPFLETTNLDPYLWNNRLLLVFVESAAAPAYAEQLRQYDGLSYELLDRDMIWFHIFQVGPDAPNALELSMDGMLELLPSYADIEQTPFAKLPDEFVEQLQGRYNPDDAAFRVVLIGKDGGVKYDSTEPLGPEQLFSIIDAMPMRQQEMQQSNP